MKRKSIFGKIYSPYSKENKDTMDDWYEDYKRDLEKTICMDGKLFYKIIWRCGFPLNEKNSILVALRPGEKIHLNDILIDEENRSFVVKSFPHFHFSRIPEWFPDVVTIQIVGEGDKIGSFLHLIKNRA